jgi:hypothetical protein
MSAYTIIDEPRPGTLARMTTDPFWPLLASMLVGVWLGWPWFLFNAYAFGSATRQREVLTAAIGLASTAALVWFGQYALADGLINESAFTYAAVIVTAWKLGVSYLLHWMQYRSFEVYTYYGAATKRGVTLLVAGFLVRPTIFRVLESDTLKLIFG